jgi:hypothetical protein
MAAAGCLVAVSSGCSSQQKVLLQGFGGTAIVSADGRTLTVGPYGGMCGDTVTAVARESRTTVALFLQEVPNGPACLQGRGTMAMVLGQRIRLRAPLGDRKLVDGKTGTATPWLSARLALRPRLIPAGYRSTGLVPWSNPSLDGWAVRPASCMQIYRTRSGPQEFEIIQSAAGLRLPPGGGYKPVLVRGHSGFAAVGVITWREQGLTDVISSSGGLTTAQLVAIADSAPA